MVVALGARVGGRDARGGLELPVTDEKIDRLRDFGLSEYAARAYLALLALGPAEAREVSTLGKVPTSKLYHVLDQLHERGLVSIIPESPRRYAPLPFEHFVDRLRADRRREIERLDHARDELADTFRITGGAPSAERGGFLLARGRRYAMERISAALAEARQDILIVTTPAGLMRLASLADEVRAASARGVRVRILARAGPASAPGAAILADVAQVRERPLQAVADAVTFVAVDDARTLTFHHLPDDENVIQGRDLVLECDHPAIARANVALLENVWSAATEARPAAPSRAVPVSDASRGETTTTTR